MLIGDPIQIKLLEKKLKRELTPDEKSGQTPIRIRINKQQQSIRIEQVYILWIHNNNSCK